MRSITVGLVAWLALSACTKKNPTYCDDSGDRPCDDGFHCVEHSCEPDGDAAPGVDARSPVVETHQAADLVLGQAGFEQRIVSPCTATTIDPRDVVEVGERVYGADQNHRVLIWNPIPTVNNAAATIVVGQPDFTHCDGPLEPDARTFTESIGLFAAGERVFVVEKLIYRVMIWGSIGTSYEAADLVLGQPNLTSTAPSGGAANQLADPEDVWSDGQQVVVADTANDRILIWNEFPTADREPADVVVGHPDFGNFGTPAASSSTLNHPTGVWVAAGRLFVADTGNNRVLIWSSIPTQNGQPADVVVGADSFDEAPAPDLSAHGFDAPTDIVANDDALFVADSQNDRILVFSPIPTTSGPEARYVLGQSDLTTGANDLPPSQRSLNRPGHLSLGPSGLWVADRDNYRMLRYRLYLE